MNASNGSILSESVEGFVMGSSTSSGFLASGFLKLLNMLVFYGGLRISLFLLKRAENLLKPPDFVLGLIPNLGSGFLKLKLMLANLGCVLDMIKLEL